MVTKTAPDKGQGPCSGRSCFGNSAGFARQRTRGVCCASHKAATCAPTRVKSGPETPAVDTSRCRGRREVRLEIVNLDRTGSPCERVCKALCGLRCILCSRSARSGFPDALRIPWLAREITWFWGASDGIGDSAARVTDEQITCAHVGNPSNREAYLGCAVTSWLHAWLDSGRREIPAGSNHPRGRDEEREARTAAMTSREKSTVCELPCWCAKREKKKEKSKPRHFG